MGKMEHIDSFTRFCYWLADRLHDVDGNNELQKR